MNLNFQQSSTALDAALADVGLSGLDAIGRRHVRRLIAKKRTARPFRGAHAATLNGLESLDELNELADLAGFGKSLKKSFKSVAKVVEKVAVVVPAAALFVPTKGTLKAAAKGLAIGATGAAAFATGGAAAAVTAAPGIISATKSAISTPAPAPAPQATYTPEPMTGQYLAAGEPDPVAIDPSQWIPGIDNKWVLLGSAVSLTGVLFLVVNRRQRRERSNAA